MFINKLQQIMYSRKKVFMKINDTRLVPDGNTEIEPINGKMAKSRNERNNF
jgi:hypothetical protein